MSVPCEYTIAMYFAYCRIFCIFQQGEHSSFFLQELAFSMAVLTLFVFLLLISISFRYRDHLVANRMAPSMCPDPCEMRWGSWFQAVLYHISAAYLVFIWPAELVAWHSGRTSVSGRRTFPVLRSTCSWWVTTNVGKLSTIGQPTRPTQPFILSGSINWVVSRCVLPFTGSTIWWKLRR